MTETDAVQQFSRQPICLRVALQGRDGATAQTVRFDRTEVLVGRSQEVDVCLPDPAVSLVHLRLVRSEDRLAAVDLGSTNGSWVDGERLDPAAPRTLEIGSRIIVGPFELQCVAAEDCATGTASLARLVVQQVIGALGQPPRLEVVDGPNRGLRVELPVSAEPVTVGRGEECSLRLTDADVSRVHLELCWEAGALLARDRGSKNGLSINDQQVTDELALGHGDELRLGSTRLRLLVPGQPCEPEPGVTPLLSSLSSLSSSSASAARPVDELQHCPDDHGRQSPAQRGRDRAGPSIDDTAARPSWWRDPYLLGGAGLVVVALAAILWLVLQQ